MKFNLNQNFEKLLKLIVKNALNHQIGVFFVGGAVRDNLLGIEIKDFDLIIDSNAIEFSKDLPDEITIKSIHEKFGTVKLRYSDIDVDLASTRREVYPNSGCLPQVVKIGVNIEEDVKRRDFTLNSLYCKITLEDNRLKYELIDLIDGVNDLRNCELKVLHSNSYIDDPTRIFRGLSYKYRFGFNFSDNDKKLIKEYLKNITYENRSNDRILAVLTENLNTEYGYLFFKDFIKENFCKILSKNIIDVDFAFIDSILEKFNLQISQRAEFLLSILLDKEVFEIKKNDEDKVFNCFRKISNSELAFYYYKVKDENVIKFLKIKDISISLKGADLLALGYKQGKIFNEIFQKLLEEKISNPNLFLSKNDELKFVEKNFPKL